MRVLQSTLVIAVLGLGLAGRCLSGAPVKERTPAVPMTPTAPVAGHSHQPFEATVREARYWQHQARQRVVEDREALEAWDPGVDSVISSREWREEMARDRDGALRRARAAARRAAQWAHTPDERYRATALQAALACDQGDHKAELQQAQRLLALDPGNELSRLWLRRAARCNHLQRLEQQADRALKERRGQFQPLHSTGR